MLKVVKIVITGCSGYVPSEYEYKDRLIVTDHSAEYDCKPYKPWEMNPVQKRSYTTNSLAFRKLFELAVRAVDEIFVRDPQCPGIDMPVTGFEVFFENGDYTEKTYMVRPDEFSACFAILKKMVPNCELMPWTLQTSEDYHVKRVWHEILEYEADR